MSPAPHRFARLAVLTVVALVGPVLPVADAAAPVGAAVMPAPVAAASVANGKYAGNVLEKGKPQKKEWVRFRVKAHKKVVSFKSRVWLHCYSYPNTYYSLPVVFGMPKTKIRKGRIDRSWQKSFRVEGETETLKGKVQLRFRSRGKVTGRLSIDLANCATRLGDAPYWVRLKARHR
ncbi:hypothetical protein ASG90_16080 [Nocardioides sp. Soil797]|nr:hypothetical protein ASG90_16080 [Nocardioides sp. Soil797]